MSIICDATEANVACNDASGSCSGPFRRASFNEALRRDGVVTLPWLTPVEIDALAQTVAEASADVDFTDVHIPTNFRLSAFTNDAAYKSRLFDRVYAQLETKIEDILEGYVPLVINLFEKFPESGGDAVPIHQNPSFVEEPKFKSISLWLPLQDVSKENGTLGVLKGSHGKFYPMRAGNMPHHEVFAPVAKALEAEHFQPLEVAKGDVVALDDSIVHWSYPNVSQVVRRAVQLIMVPVEAPHIYYYYNTVSSNPTMDLFQVDRTFFYAFNCNEFPVGLRKIASLPFKYEAVTPDMIFGATGA